MEYICDVPILLAYSMPDIIKSNIPQELKYSWIDLYLLYTISLLHEDVVVFE